MENNTYKPSNKFNIAGFLLIILAVAGVGCLLSALYLKINEINPIVYLTILLTCGFGALLGLIANLIIKKSKIRNPGMAILAVLIGALAFTYFKWALYISWDNQNIMDEIKTTNSMSKHYYLRQHPNADKTFTEVLTSPSLLLEEISDVNEQGRWTYKANHSSTTPTTPVKGIPLTIIWIAEAGILLLIPMIMASIKAKCPFSETDNEWMAEYKTPFMFGNYDLTRNKQRILDYPDELFNIPYLDILQPRQSYIKGILYHSTDFSECYLTLAIQTHNKKNDKYDSVNIIEYLKLNFPQVERLFDHCHLNKPFASTTSYNYQQPYQAPQQNTQYNNGYAQQPYQPQYQAPQQNPPMNNGYAQPTYQQPTYEQPQPAPKREDYVNPDEFFK